MAKKYIDWDNDFSYPLQWIQESEFARRAYSCLCYRVDLAMEGKPYENLYKKEVNSLMQNMSEEQKKMLGEHCKEIPEGHSLLLAQSINTIANQMASGVDNYECTINDPYGFVEDGTEDLLAAKCTEDYIENRLELMAPTFSKDLQRYGMVATLVKFNPKNNKNEVLRINPRNTWFDTMYSSTGRQRFCGYSTMIPWSQLKKMVKDEGDEINTDLKVPSRSNLSEDKKQVLKARYSQKKIKTLNDLDIYVDDINRLAVSPDLQGTPFAWSEYQHDLGSCYNLGYYRSWAMDPKAQTNSGYHGDDVELTVIYDLNRKIEFKIINRRYVISMNKKAFRRNVIFPVHNLITDEVTDRIEEVELDCPLKIQFATSDTMDKYPYPTSPAMRVLEIHNELCSWFAKREHVSKLLATLRIETNGADANSLKKVMNVMGVILDDIQGDINSINFQYSYEPIDSQITVLTQQMKEYLSAYTEFDAMQAMGDRASAAESGMAIGAISQGLASHQNILMALYADIARQCLFNRVVYSPAMEFPVNNAGNYTSLTAAELATAAIVTAKPKLAQKVHENMVAQQALALLGSATGQNMSAVGQAWLMEKSLYGMMPRKLAATFIREAGPTPEETALAQQQAANQAQMLQANQALYEQNPLPYEGNYVTQTYSPEDQEAIIAQLSQSGDGGVTDETLMTDISNGGIETLDMQQQEGAMALNMEEVSPLLGSAAANPSGYYG